MQTRNAGSPADDPPSKLTSAQFAEQFGEAYPRLWRLAVALVSERNEAEDLVQDAALVALKKLSDFQPGTNFNAWMGRIVRMHALNWRRKKAGRRTSPADPVDLDQSQSGAEPVEETSYEESVAKLAAGDTSGVADSFDDELLRCLNALDQTPRACLLLRIVQGMSYEEIGALLEIPTGTAMSHVHRSKKRLREEMAATGQESPT